MLRSAAAERAHSALPTARTSAGLLQYIPGRQTGDPPGSDGDRRPVPVLGQESCGEMGRADCRGARGTAPDGFVLQYMQDAEDDHVAVILKRTGTGANPGGDRRKGQRQSTLGA